MLCRRLPHGSERVSFRGWRSCEWLQGGTQPVTWHMARSVMEGATYGMRDTLEIIRGMQIPVKKIHLSGSGARSEYWRQMQADVYGQPIATIDAEEGPAYGVALLAAAGTGAYRNVVETCKATISVVSKTKPTTAAEKAYKHGASGLREMYRSLRDDFTAIQDVV